MNYKQTLKLFFFSFLTLIIAFPLTSLAVSNGSLSSNTTGRNNKKEDIKKTSTVNKFCQAITTQTERIKNRFTERINQRNQKRTATETKIEQKRATRLAKINQNREQRKVKLAEVWKKLETKAQTDEQKTAVKKFEQSIQTAIDTKNTAMAKIVTDYRVAVKNEFQKRRSEIDAQITSYKNSSFSIVDQITTDCSNGKNAKEIRENYRNTIKEARTKFQTSGKTFNTLKDDLATLRENKKSEAQVVRETFKKSLEDAKAELRTSLSHSSSTNSTQSVDE